MVEGPLRQGIMDHAAFVFLRAARKIRYLTWDYIPIYTLLFYILPSFNARVLQPLSRIAMLFDVWLW